jgi:mono/diheme cytochrome c family protein
MKTIVPLILVSAVLAQPPTGSADHGKQVFEKDGCYECHGHMGQGGRDGPRIAATALSLQALTRYIRRPLGSMPAFTEKVLPDAQVRDIYAFLKSIPPAKAPKDIPLLKDLETH